ncbi:ABC transporter ATP-binding protein [Mangrovicoccus ximenensis]|uniref:ABC transporter ATP-binding protein n=1 Tax=Mangrovicoccus ximenensis TaxID=1911570 RepID=UPI000D3A591F|nr:oligopeptide/dipeptide ABC transporter ATP-binding protein [Mangrovicoccus ximenensis]
MTTPVLETLNLEKRFPAGSKGLFGKTDRWVNAVSDVSLRLAEGETLGIVGESGCGKSTTARLIMDLVTPDSGEILFDGQQLHRDRANLRAYRRNVQMVFQDSSASLNPRLTLEQSVMFAPVQHGVPRAEARARARELLEQVGLDPARFAGRYPHEVSGGQRQRVNIARALALRPRVVIFDEAVSALDKSVEAQVLNLLADLKEAYKLSYIFISHDLNVVRHISDRVLVMYLGQVIEEGPAADLYAHPRHPYTQALLASMPSHDPDRRTTAPPITGDPPSPIDLPPGCRFAPRCAFASDLCTARAPLPVAAGRQTVACHLADPASGHPLLNGAKT